MPARHAPPVRQGRNTMTQPTWELSGFGDEIDADPVVQVAVLQALGASAIEVRSAWGTNVVDLDEDQLAGLHRLFEERGQTVSAVASPIGKVPVDEPVEHEVSRLARAIRAAHALGTTNIRIFSFYFDGSAPRTGPRRRPRPDAGARRPGGARGRHLLHENEKDIYGDVPERVLDVVESVGSSALRLAWDNRTTCSAACAVHRRLGAARAYVDYLQVKDALAADGSVVPAGEGDGELLLTLTALRDAGYAGYASLEPHLTDVNSLGGFSGPAAFGRAGRAFRSSPTRSESPCDDHPTEARRRRRRRHRTPPRPRRRTAPGPAGRRPRRCLPAAATGAADEPSCDWRRPARHHRDHRGRHRADRHRRRRRSLALRHARPAGRGGARRRQARRHREAARHHDAAGAADRGVRRRRPLAWAGHERDQPAPLRPGSVAVAGAAHGGDLRHRDVRRRDVAWYLLQATTTRATGAAPGRSTAAVR